VRCARDALLLAGAAALIVSLTLLEGWPPTGLPFLVGVSVAVCLPLLWSRTLPVTAAAASLAVAVVGSAVPGWPGRLVAMVALCSAAYRRRMALGGMLAICLGLTAAYAVLVAKTPGIATFGDLLVLGLAPLVTGYALRLQRDRTRETVRLRIAEDRARLARDMHDSVGHHLTAIRMQAAATRRVLHGSPPNADRALGTITDLASSALGDVRALLNTLREEASGLADVGGLVERLSGPGCRITVHGLPLRLPPAIDHVAYCVVQEALTNAVRHAEATEVEVHLRCRHGELEVSVTDDGGPLEGFVAGQGIRGMRERVDQVGGTLSAGPREPAGWAVRACLPLKREPG
jgi:signal transduction histidine kinase